VLWDARAAKASAKQAAAAVLTEQSNLSGAAGPLPSPEKALIHRLAASWDAMVEWIKDLGALPERLDVDTQAGKYQGKFVTMDDLHAIQKTGRITYSIHLLEILDKKPVLGNIETRVQYKNGSGVVTGEPDRGDRGKGR
jgi:hypothetical protein